PGVDAACDERGRRADREHDTGGGTPVVADDEVPPEVPERADASHANARRRRRRSATDENDSTITNPSTPGSEASSPGQCAPAPSAPQKMPNVVSITPT